MDSGYQVQVRIPTSLRVLTNFLYFFPFPLSFESHLSTTTFILSTQSNPKTSSSTSSSCLAQLPHVPDHPQRLRHISITAHVRADPSLSTSPRLTKDDDDASAIQSSSPSSIDFRLIRKSCSDFQRQSIELQRHVRSRAVVGGKRRERKKRRAGAH